MEKHDFLRYNAMNWERVETPNGMNFHIVMEILEQLRYNIRIGV